jgi:hypothetical protein
MTIVTTLFRRFHPAAAAPLPAVSRVRRGPPPSGVGQYHVFDAPNADLPGGPTHQPGVMPGHGYEPLRTPFGQVGTPGAGLERNVTNLDLAANQHPDGSPFAAANGRSTRQVPSMNGQQAAGARPSMRVGRPV